MKTLLLCLGVLVGTYGLVLLLSAAGLALGPVELGLLLLLAAGAVIALSSRLRTAQSTSQADAHVAGTQYPARRPKP